MKRLSRIQLALKAPKDQKNKAGNFSFSYRKASDILQAVKPLLEEEHLSILLADSIHESGGRFFLKATASLYDAEGELIADTSAYAEMGPHAGMSAEQATGAASSYARKYALCGLFAIDDSTSDPDTISPLPQRIEDAKTAEAMNALLAEVKVAADEIKSVFNNRVIALGLTFDKSTGKLIAKS